MGELERGEAMGSEVDVKIGGLRREAIVYPESDGLPMADNTEQFDLITLIKTNLDAIFAARPDVFVAGNLFWYPVEGRPDIRQAPDVLVVEGRPKGFRSSYKQWEEEGVALQLAVEVLGNYPKEMREKREFYEHFGVVEYIEIAPRNLSPKRPFPTVKVWARDSVSEPLVEVADAFGWRSRFGIYFEREGAELFVVGPDGRRFTRFEAERQARDAAESLAETERIRAEAAEERAEAERIRAETAEERADAERLRAEAERQARDAAEERAKRLEARLRELGIDPETAP